MDEDWRLIIILIIRVSSFSFLIFNPMIVMYHTSIMLEFCDIGFGCDLDINLIYNC